MAGPCPGSAGDRRDPDHGWLRGRSGEPCRQSDGQPAPYLANAVRRAESIAERRPPESHTNAYACADSHAYALYLAYAEAQPAERHPVRAARGGFNRLRRRRHHPEKPVGGLPGGKLKAGQSFTILKDEGKTWIVKRGKAEGRLTASRAMLNLPHVIPSIVYRDVNADASIFQSSGVDLPGVTGRRLYESRAVNDKLAAEEYFMPVLYPMVKRIHRAQQQALANDETLIMYQTFRPHDTQLAVARSPTKLHKTNKKVRAGIDGGGWGISSFIAVNLSNHQLGVAIDVSLGKGDRHHHP